MLCVTTYNTTPKFKSISLLYIGKYCVYEQLKSQSQVFKLEAISTAQSELCTFYSCLQ